MHHLTNLVLAIQHRQEFRADTARARVAAAAILDHTGRS